MIFLFVVIMFFGITGRALPDNPAPKTTISSVATKPSGGVYASVDDSACSVPEPITLVLLGSGLVAIAAFGRKKFRQ
jgi:hypothetical protein